MAVETPGAAVESGAHVVQFYKHDVELVGAVAPYLMAAARAEEVAIVIATEAHRRAFAAELEAGGIDLAQSTDGPSVLWRDAASTMAALIDGERIDHGAFHEVIGGLLREASASGRAVRVYGEIVALLWDAGNVVAAIELERLWNELARELPFSLFCAYRSASVAGSDHADALHEVCDLHSSVLGPLSALDSAADRSSEFELRARFPAERDSPGHARRLVVARLRQSGHGEKLVQDTGLVLSELATNAVLHASSAFSIAVRVQDAIVSVGVQDGSPLAGSARDAGLFPRRGHGLGLIDALSLRWGVEGVPDGKVVWAELSRS